MRGLGGGGILFVIVGEEGLYAERQTHALLVILKVL